jgi:uncharacterized protein YukJ
MSMTRASPARREAYGVLRGRPLAISCESDERSPHCHILVAAGVVNWRVAVNVRTRRRPGTASALLFRIVEDFRHPRLELLDRGPGFTPLPPDPGSGALDYVRADLFGPARLAPITPGQDALVAELTQHFERAADAPDGEVFAFGTAWRPRRGAADPVFGFSPARGMHNVHMNQGSPSAPYRNDNGVWRDGALLFRSAHPQRWTAIFLAFDSQSWRTDDETGHPIEPDWSLAARLRQRG